MDGSINNSHVVGCTFVGIRFIEDHAEVRWTHVDEAAPRAVVANRIDSANTWLLSDLDARIGYAGAVVVGAAAEPPEGRDQIKSRHEINDTGRAFSAIGVLQTHPRPTDSTRPSHRAREPVSQDLHRRAGQRASDGFTGKLIVADQRP